MIDEKLKPNRLPRDHIKVGNLIWYSGRTSMDGWNCPAEIVYVNEEAQVFRVKSLDDCREQRQPYSFDIGPHTPDSRCSMFVPSSEEMDLWLHNEVGICRSTGITKGSDLYVHYFQVNFDHRGHPAFEWAIERWARKHGIEANYGMDRVLRNNFQFRFRSMEDAALCHLTFSQGMKWSMIE